MSQSGEWPPQSLATVVNNLSEAAHWSIKNFTASDNGEQIARSLIDGTATAVCDGSYKDGKGSSAWALEGTSQEGRILGTNLPPGPRSVQIEVN